MKLEFGFKCHLFVVQCCMKVSFAPPMAGNTKLHLSERSILFRVDASANDNVVKTLRRRAKGVLFTSLCSGSKSYINSIVIADSYFVPPNLMLSSKEVVRHILY